MSVSNLVTRRPSRLVLALAAAFPPALPLQAQTIAQPLAQTIVQPGPSDAPGATPPVKALGVVTIVGGSQPTSLPTQIPATMEGVTAEQIARTINATDSEDALKYLPSLNVRKRYTGDYDHAPLRSPSEALPCQPLKRSSVRYSVKPCEKPDSFTWASRFVGMRVWKSTTAPTELPGYAAANGP
jgi:hypothetical protein